MTHQTQATLSPFWQSFYATNLELTCLQSKSYVKTNSSISSAYYALHHLGLVSILGVDACTFLQGQLTADVSTLTTGTSSLAAHCDHKGRMQANGILFCLSSTHYLWQMPYDMIENAKKSLAKYAVFSKVELNSTPEKWFALGCTSNLTECFSENMAVIPVPNTELSCLWLEDKASEGSQEYASQIIKQGSGKWQGSTDWDALMINAGIAYVQPETMSEFIPQMLNLDQLEGISFTKGCYTGQEIIARMKYRGAVKRRCYQFVANLAPSLLEQFTVKNKASNYLKLVGTAIYNSEQKNIGTVATGQVYDNKIIGLAVVKIDELNTPLTLLLTDTSDNVQKVLINCKEPLDDN